MLLINVTMLSQSHYLLSLSIHQYDIGYSVSITLCIMSLELGKNATGETSQYLIPLFTGLTFIWNQSLLHSYQGDELRADRNSTLGLGSEALA